MRHLRFLSFVVFGLVGAFGSGATLLSGQSVEVASGIDKKQASSTPGFHSLNLKGYGNFPPSFELNEGQTDPRVQFLVRGANYEVFLAAREAILVFGNPPSEIQNQPGSFARIATRLIGQTQSGTSQGRRGLTSRRASPVGFRIQLAGASAASLANGLDELPGKSNYLIGTDSKKWNINVPHYAKVQYQSVYPGVDLVYYINQRHVEYDFVVAPQADPGAIRMSILGLKEDARLQVDRHGDLIARTKAGELRLPKPVVYQPEVLRGLHKISRTYLDAQYAVKGHEVTFRIPPRDRTRPLIIDPVVTYSTFLGGTGYDQGNAIAVDSSGNAYVVGQTMSLDFPVVQGDLETSSSALGCVALYGNEAFVTKLNPSGSALVYSTYLGGPGCAIGTSIAIDSAGNAYLTGSAGPGFPTTSQAFQKTYGGSGNTSMGDAFVAKLNTTGTALVYSTYVGGFSGDIANGIALDAGGNAYIVGQTFSNDFPTLPPGGVCSDLSNSSDFVTKLNADGSALPYSRCLGKPDIGYGIAVSSAGNAYVTGEGSAGATSSSIGSCTFGGGGYAAKLNPDGTTAFVDCFPGNGLAIAIDTSGDTYLTGYTSSSAFPTTTGAFQTSCNTTCSINGFSDAFVMELDPTGTSVLYSTYLGGSGIDLGTGITVDPSGNAHLIGNTSSADFPTVNPTQSTFGGSGGIGDAFVTELNGNGSSLLFSTFLGGSKDEMGTGIALDTVGSVYVTGSTASSDFSVTSGSFQTSFAGPAGVPGDVFITKFGAPDFSLAASTPAPSSLSAGQSSTSTVTVTSIADFNVAVSLTCSVTPSPANAPGCSLSPSGVTPPPSGPITATLTIATTAPTAALASFVGYAGLIYIVWVPIFGALLARRSHGSRRGKRRNSLGFLACAILFAGLIFQLACGGGGGNGGGSGGTSKGDYTIAITGTSGSLSHSTTVMLTVQ